MYFWEENIQNCLYTILSKTLSVLGKGWWQGKHCYCHFFFWNKWYFHLFYLFLRDICILSKYKVVLKDEVGHNFSKWHLFHMYNMVIVNNMSFLVKLYNLTIQCWQINWLYRFFLTLWYSVFLLGFHSSLPFYSVFFVSYFQHLEFHFSNISKLNLKIVHLRNHVYVSLLFSHVYTFKISGLVGSFCKEK